MTFFQRVLTKFRNIWAVITLNPSQLSEVQKLLKKIKQGNKMPFL